ncbi:MAG: S1 RNA-binding domain-containing protein [Candidatus Levyibacteriota bacterium]
MPTSSKNASNPGHASSMAELMARSSSSFKVFKKGEEVEGTVKKLTPQEILLDIGAKSDALVLEVDKNNLNHLLSMLKVGEKVKAVVISPEAEEGFPVVSLRRTLGNLIFSNLDKALADNLTVSVKVLEPTRGGFFVEAENGIRGFLPNSQVLDGENLSGKTIEVKIIESDKTKKRAIFSQKAVSYVTDAEILRKLFPKDKKVPVTVSQVASYGVYVTTQATEGKLTEGFIHISEISHERVENLNDLYKKGDAFEAVVLSVDAENRRVNLSVKSLLNDSFAKAAEKFKPEEKVTGTVSDVRSKGVTVKLGDGVNGFISSSKIPAGTTYEPGQSVSAEVVEVDTKKRVVVLSPIVTKTFVGYR